MVPAGASSQSLASRRDLLIAYHDRPLTCRQSWVGTRTGGTSNALRRSARPTPADHPGDESVVTQRARTTRFRRRCGLRTPPSGCFLV